MNSKQSDYVEHEREVIEAQQRFNDECGLVLIDRGIDNVDGNKDAHDQQRNV